MNSFIKYLMDEKKLKQKERYRSFPKGRIGAAFFFRERRREER